MCSFIQEVNEEPPPKSEPNSSGSNKSDQYTLEYVYHHNLTKEVTTNVKNMAV